MRDNTLRVYRPEEYTSGPAHRKSGNPTQPGYRSTASKPAQRKKKHVAIVRRFARFCKRLNWKGRILLGLLVLTILAAPFLIGNAIAGSGNSDRSSAADTTPPPAETMPTEQPPEYVFRDGEGYPVDVQAMAAAWAAEAGYEIRYELTDAERWEIASVLTAEAAGEPLAGKVAVAQCILQTCEDEDLRPSDVLVKYCYSKRRPEPTEEALEAVQAVFDFGHVATNQPIKYFYAPALTDSEWHESQVYVLTINGHRFFKEATN